MLAATAGAILTSLSVTPFDVIKVRMQSQLRGGAMTRQAQLLQQCSHIPIHTGLADVWCRKCDVVIPPNPLRGPVDAATRMVRHEGLGSLWRGLGPTLFMSVPATIVYFNLYDKLKDELDLRGKQGAPLIAGVSARAFTTTLVSPIELIRTKAQAQKGKASVWELTRGEISQKTGILRLWRGASPTLWRDVPFSAVYWMGYETFKKALADKRERSSSSFWKNLGVGWSSFVCGASSGAIAATVTHPFDLVKTRRQIEMYAMEEMTAPPAARKAALTPCPCPSNVAPVCPTGPDSASATNNPTARPMHSSTAHDLTGTRGELSSSSAAA